MFQSNECNKVISLKIYLFPIIATIFAKDNCIVSFWKQPVFAMKNWSDNVDWWW